MCGGFSLGLDLQKIAVRFTVSVPLFEYPLRYNIRPSQMVPTILNSKPNEMSLSYWGFMPVWGKKESDNIINVRKDSLASKKTFIDSFKNRRCLIIADGFYEWRKDKSTKTPFRIMLKSGEPFAFAGIWQEDKDHGSQFAIVTTEPNSLVAKVHNRMPAILRPDIEKDWLDQSMKEKDLLNLIKPYSAEDMKLYEVSRAVNSARNEGPRIALPARLFN